MIDFYLISRSARGRFSLRREAFTIVELLVVVAIIAILVSMLLPAIQQTREAARRASCMNNIRQVTLAINAYQTADSAYPRAGLVNSEHPRFFFNPRSGKMISWAVLILPFLDEQSLADRFDLRTSVLRQVDDPQATHISVMHCPSDGAANRYFVHPMLTEGKRFAKGNYAAYVSPFHVDNHPLYPGAIVAHRRQGPKHIMDGLARTIVLGEIRTRDNEQDQRGAWALPWTGSSLLAFDMHASNKLFDPFEHNQLSLSLTQRPNNQGPNVDMLYECQELADAQLHDMPCGKWEENGEFRYLSAATRSLHPGGALVAFLDNHVQYIADDVDEVVMAYAVSIDDGSLTNLVDE